VKNKETNMLKFQNGMHKIGAGMVTYTEHFPNRDETEQ
jgi:hypothetical protein